MNRFIFFLIIVLASHIFSARASAQNSPPTQAAVETALAQQKQKRAAIRTLEDQTAALERAATLLSQNPADQPYLVSIRSMMAESKQQLVAATKDYEAVQAVLRDAEVPKARP